MKTIIEYHYRGSDERGYDKHEVAVYSPNGDDGEALYPWMTKSECKLDAKRNGAKAKFVRDGWDESE